MIARQGNKVEKENVVSNRMLETPKHTYMQLQAYTFAKAAKCDIR